MITVNIFSKIPGEVNKFLSHFYNTNLSLDTALSWNKNYANPIEITEIIGTFIDNIDDYSLNMCISLDKGIYLHVTEHNADDIIKYLYERFPY